MVVLRAVGEVELITQLLVLIKVALIPVAIQPDIVSPLTKQMNTTETMD